MIEITQPPRNFDYLRCFVIYARQEGHVVNLPVLECDLMWPNQHLTLGNSLMAALLEERSL